MFVCSFFWSPNCTFGCVAAQTGSHQGTHCLVNLPCFRRENAVRSSCNEFLSSSLCKGKTIRFAIRLVRAAATKTPKVEMGLYEIRVYPNLWPFKGYELGVAGGRWVPYLRTLPKALFESSLRVFVKESTSILHIVLYTPPIVGIA